MSDFNWQTEEENGDWAEEVSVGRQTAEKPKRSWWLFLLVGVVVAAAGIVLYRQVQTQIDETTQTTEEEVLAAHQLLLSAVAAGDRELFYAQLSGREPAWTQSQDLLMAAGLWFDAAALGLYRSADFTLNAAQTVSVTLAPDLLGAEVVTTFPYTVTETAESLTPIYLQQTAVYRRSSDQKWLLAPPLEEFWGGTAIINTQFLSLQFPVRDQVWAERLTFDLDALIHRACRTFPELTCNDFLHVTLRLETNPSVLLAVSDPANLLQSNQFLEAPNFISFVMLPTFTLVGLPMDEVGYQALYRGYAAQVLTAVFARWANYPCCEHGLIFQALLDKQLSQLGVRSWPLTPDDYQQLLFIPLHNRIPAAAYRLEYGPPDRFTDWRQLYTFVEFLAETHSIIEMQQQLSLQPTYVQWQQAILGQDILSPEMITAWERHLHQQTASAALAEPSTPLPQADILRVCTAALALTETVYRYNIGAAGWQSDFVWQIPRGQNKFDASIVVLPDGNGYLLQNITFTNNVPVASLSWWQDGQETVITDVTSQTAVSPPLNLRYSGASDPNGRFLFLTSFFPEQPFSYLLDRENCQPGQCPLRPTPWQWMFWSPDGQHTLTLVLPSASEPEGQLFELQGADSLVITTFPPPDETAELVPDAPALYLGDNTGQPIRFIGYGWQPGWLNNEQFLYPVWQQTHDTPSLVLGHVAGTDQVISLHDEDFLAVLPPELQVDLDELFHFEMAWPFAPNYLMVLSAKEGVVNPDFHIFLAKLDTTTAQFQQVVYLTTIKNWAVPRVSPNGRWATIYHEFDHVLQIFDLETGQLTQSVPGVDIANLQWSPDGNWLLLEYPTHLLLFEPESEYIHFVPRPATVCDTAVWSKP